LWEYTPRQASAWATLGFARKRTEMAESLALQTMAAREKPEAINKQLKEWNDG
jgi:hypothetical protein